MIHALARLVVGAALVVSLGGNLASSVPSAHAAPSLGVTLGANWTNAPSAAHPDDTITYTAKITNSGSTDAHGVSLSETPDGNTSLVPNSVQSSPIARPDAFSAIGNVPITVNAPGLLANDSDPDGDTVSVTSSDSTSAHGGAVSVGGDGSFTYAPPAGFNGTDSFSYTVGDGHGSHDTASVSVSVSGRIWFIDNSQSANGNGTLTTPFNSLSSFAAVNDGAAGHPAAGDAIFVYSHTTSSYGGPVSLLAGQQFIGQGAHQSITALTGLTPPSGSATLPATGGNNPVLAGSGATLTVGSNDLIDGVTINNSGGTALTGNGFGTLTVADTSLANSAGQAISLSNGSLSATFTSVSAAGAANGISISNTTGSFSVTGDGATAGSGGTIQNISGNGASFSNASNVALSYMNFTSANTTDASTCTDDPSVSANTNLSCNGAVYLASVSGVTLNHVAIDTTEQNGINGNAVTNFALRNSTISNAGTKSVASPADTIESGALFDNLLGTASITNSTLRNNGATDLEVRNNSGTLNALTLTGDTFGATGNGNQANDAGQGGVKLIGDGAAVMNADLEGSSISGVDGNGLTARGDGSAHMGLTIGKTAGNTISTTTGLGSGISVATLDAGITKFDIENNTITHTGASNIVVNLASGVNTANTAIGGTISHNTLGVQGTPGSATNAAGHGVALFPGTAGQFTVAVTNNQIFGTTGTGIMVQATNGSEASNVTITGNTVDVDRAGSNGVFVQNGGSTGGDSSTLCADINGNNLHNSATYSSSRFAIQLASNSSGALSLPGYGGVATDTAAVRGFEAGQNQDGASQLATSLVRVTAAGAGAGYSGGSCATPPSPPVTLLRHSSASTHASRLVTTRAHGAPSTNRATTAPRVHLRGQAEFASGNSFSIGVLPAGHSVTVTFQATVNSQITNPNGATNVSDSIAVTDADGDSTGASASTPISLFDTQTALTSSPTTPVFGQAVTLSATVSTAASGTLTGSVQFFDGSTALGTPQGLSGTGTASLTTAALSVASHTLKAVYSGDNRFATSTGTLGQTVGKASTSAAITSTAGSSTFGQPVTFIATISVNSPGTDAVSDPTGAVAFSDGSTSLGSGTLHTANGVTTASVTVATLSVGSHTITATYAGDGSFNGSSVSASAGVGQAVQKANTSSSVSSSALTSRSGQAVTFTATVGSTVGVSPTGTVTFYDGASAIGTGTLSGNGGTATATLGASALSVGSHSITAAYGGDGNFNGSTSTAITQTVQKADTTTTLISSAPTSAFGQSVTLTATVAINSPGTNAPGDPTGAVTFFDGSTQVGTVALSTTGGVTTATFTTSALSVGSHTLAATYAGDGSRNGSSGSANQTVNKASTQTSVSTSVTPSAFGQAVTFTATITVSAPGTTAAADPGGSVAFSDGSNALGTVAVSTNHGVTTATVTTGSLAVGSHTIAAAYSGDGNFTGSSGSAGQTVNKAATTTTVASSVSPSAFGQTLTVTATVAVNSPGTTAVAVPTGTVTFSDGNTPVGAGSLSTTNGVTTATFTTSALAVGSHTIAAAYAGDGNFLASSGSTNEAVNRAATTTTLSSSVNPSLPGHAVTFTATVSVVAPGTTQNANPTGSVTFADNGTQIGVGTVSTSNGVTTASFTTSSLGTGSHPITASYGGDGNFGASSAALTQSVDKVPTTTSVASSVNPSIVGQSVTFTATVAPAGTNSATPSGSVDFYDGSTKVATVALSGGQATYTTSALAIGSHAISVQYGGDGTFKPSTGTLTQNVSYSVNLLYDPTQAKQSGSTIPIKLQLFDSTGNNLNSSSVTLTLASPSVSPDPGAAQPTGTFSLNGNHYQYNLKTTGFAPGTYTLRFTAGNDPVVHTAGFTIK